MNNIFQNIFNDYIIFYLNDIFVYSNKTFKDYKQKIDKILNCFDKYIFYFNSKK